MTHSQRTSRRAFLKGLARVGQCAVGDPPAVLFTLLGVGWLARTVRLESLNLF